jgi:hypothetical protein
VDILSDIEVLDTVCQTLGANGGDFEAIEEAEDGVSIVEVVVDCVLVSLIHP